MHESIAIESSDSENIIQLKRAWNEMVRAINEGDNGAAHAREDVLYYLALLSIAQEPPGCDAAYIARFVLKSKELNFLRRVGGV